MGEAHDQVQSDKDVVLSLLTTFAIDIVIACLYLLAFVLLRKYLQRKEDTPRNQEEEDVALTSSDDEKDFLLQSEHTQLETDLKNIKLGDVT